MASFSNGSEGCAYEAAYCDRCVNYRDKGDGRGPGCAIWDAHLLFAYEECNSNSNAKEILDMLIPETEGRPGECSLFQAADDE